MTSLCVRQRRHRDSLCLLLSLSLLSLVTSAASVEVKPGILKRLDEHKPHCADFLQHCAWNSSTSSCAFSQSISFVCGPREAVEAPVSIPTGSGSLLSAEAVSASSFTGYSDGDVGVSAVAGFTCHWDVPGDLHFAPGVTVAVEGDDCLLHIGSGQMVLLGARATLKASSLSVEASFVHLEVDAQISASYSGAFRDGHGLFTGTDVFGASHGGGGGQRLIANATMLTQQTTRGFFDVRGRTVDVELIEEKEALLKQSSAGWQLADLWAKEKALMADPAVMTASSGASGGPSATIAPFLLGSGSRVVIAGNGSSDHIVTVDGGGRIQIKASKDVVVMAGATIQASGASAIDGVSGGSGDNAAARGITHCFPAGGGGRVQISFMSSQLDTDAIDTTGDLSASWCSGEDGGALDIDEIDTVIGGAVTSLYVGDDEAGSIDAITITDGAVVATGCLKLSEGDLKRSKQQQTSSSADSCAGHGCLQRFTNDDAYQRLAALSPLCINGCNDCV
ncbi:hypothetical protein PC116_g12063 [Phytophthora cactorum]|uniref:Uncharacterized protein n=1 Tax=Phytophthora cactorum TaxID=29920 RepID=A0A8T0Z6R5_9STRA|nr:hypothetical protein PC111_g16706 [Phytophthora cactorum]KAG2824555.1 hypothetical protein PC112_g10042 [Phytophthora cactorum]KAG2858077.1 hypothetical protein PC113_g10133 [Phytophthora cactorum]KAG2891817.1 hypothetical protein PC114_g16833 [Phytophthora cactorum]KAG2895952.1 hypothetical protein PC115_g17650 [Phytophthora cactorum]